MSDPSYNAGQGQGVPNFQPGPPVRAGQSYAGFNPAANRPQGMGGNPFGQFGQMQPPAQTQQFQPPPQFRTPSWTPTTQFVQQKQSSDAAAQAAAGTPSNYTDNGYF